MVEVGPSHPLPLTTALGFLSVREILSQYLPGPSCEVGAWFGSSMDVKYASLNWRPLKVTADSGSSSLRRTPPM